MHVYYADKCQVKLKKKEQGALREFLRFTGNVYTLEDMGRMNQRLTWRDGPAGRKSADAKESGMVKKLQESQREGT